MVLDFCHTTALCAVESVGAAILSWAVLLYWANFILGLLVQCIVLRIMFVDRNSLRPKEKRGLKKRRYVEKYDCGQNLSQTKREKGS